MSELIFCFPRQRQKALTLMERKQKGEELFKKSNQTLFVVFMTKFTFTVMMSYKFPFFSPFWFT